MTAGEAAGEYGAEPGPERRGIRERLSSSAEDAIGKLDLLGREVGRGVDRGRHLLATRESDGDYPELGDRRESRHAEAGNEQSHRKQDKKRLPSHAPLNRFPVRILCLDV